jgi:peptidoglycan hydrolase-like protein with peptidoglycan-binding domain
VGSRETNLQNIRGDGGHGRGVWQRDDRSWNIPGNYDNDVHLQAEDAATLLTGNIRALGRAGGIAAYNCGAGNVRKALSRGKGVDAYTAGGDYSADVLARLAALGGAPPPPLGSLPLTVDGDFGTNTIAATQRACGAAADGDWGPESKKALQRHLGVGADGDIGPITIEALQQKVGAKVDGEWGSDTTSHLQQALNAKRF